METHLALVVEETDDGKFTHSFKQRETESPQEGQVLIKVSHSSLNYKDFLSLSGNRGVTKKYPHVPGIDAAGEVVESRSSLFEKGEIVAVVGFDLGMNTPGGFQQFITVNADWVIPLSKIGLSPKEAMAWGTAGFTAAQSVEKIVNAEIAKDGLPIAVSGSTGGVGSVAVMLLSKLGYKVHAFSRKLEGAQLLEQWGASKVVDYDLANDEAMQKKPLLKPLYASAVDTLGGHILSFLLRSVAHRATVTTCGMVAGIGLNLTVFPFILRGVTLAGIDSAECPIDKKRALWRHIAQEWRLSWLAEKASIVSLKQVPEKLMLMKEGKSVSRVVVSIDA